MWRSRSSDSISGRSHHSWVRWPKTTPMRWATALRWRCGERPSTSTRPAVGSRMPVSILIVVDLPAPFGPRQPTISPGRCGRRSRRTARTSVTRRSTRLRSGRERPAAVAGDAEGLAQAVDQHRRGRPLRRGWAAGIAVSITIRCSGSGARPADQAPPAPAHRRRPRRGEARPSRRAGPADRAGPGCTAPGSS